MNELMMKLHKGKNLSPKQFIEITKAVGWTAEEKNGLYKDRYLDNEIISSRLGLNIVFSIFAFGEGYEFTCKTHEQIEALYHAMKNVEVAEIPAKIKRKDMYVLNVQPIEEINGYHKFKFNAEVMFVVPQIWFYADDGEPSVLSQTVNGGYETYKFPQTVFFQKLKNKVNEILGLEDYEIEKEKKAEAERIRKIKGSAGHCAICGKVQMLRKVGDKMVMVHHGYRRPGHGEIVGDCFGVGFQPYELSNEANKAFAPIIENHLKNAESYLVKLQSGKISQLMTGSKKQPIVTPTDRNWSTYFESAIHQTERQIKYCKEDITLNNTKIDIWELQPLPKA